ncbi:sensor histidine kinase [Tenacibaculum sp. nBUS_03]|uniref:sensor histidine kinase n=1 Tax=Tenacibaculum sp. nBUS_03 TaxID=3395320 RepID=UPI003EBD727E
MPLLNKKKRIAFLGFNDVWFSVLGILMLSATTRYLFKSTTESKSVFVLLIGWFVYIFFTSCSWFIIRNTLIQLRTKYPDFKDDLKRTVYLFFSIISILLLFDTLGGILIAKLISAFLYETTHSIALKRLIPTILITIMIMAIYEAIYYYVRLKKSIRIEERTKQSMIQAQLDTLRNQVQPHFLFNSLNTLRDVIDQEEKEEAMDFVDNLSNVYRFILDAGTTNTIPLREELKFVSAYIYIQLERFGDNLQIHWEIPEAKKSALIVPMSLQLLIENAIKHNIISKAKPLLILITLEKDSIVVSNTIQPKSTQIPSTHIGLKNIEQRYALIANKKLEISKEGGQFIVKLPLLKSHKPNENISYSNY